MTFPWNWHSKVPWSRKAELLTDLMKLRTSGYNHIYRVQALTSGITGFNKMEKTERVGGKKMNSADSNDGVNRNKRKITEAKSWYKRGGG